MKGILGSRCTGQFTPKMRANADSCLLSSLVWIDYGVEVSKHCLASILIIWTPRFLSWSFQVLFGPSRHWMESSICDNLKHRKRWLEVPFFLRVNVYSLYYIQPTSSNAARIATRGPLLSIHIDHPLRTCFLRSTHSVHIDFITHYICVYG